MRRLPATSLDLMKFVQAFGVGLRAEFADAACAPVPEYLVALMRELDGDQKPPVHPHDQPLFPAKINEPPPRDSSDLSTLSAWAAQQIWGGACPIHCLG